MGAAEKREDEMLVQLKKSDLDALVRSAVRDAMREQHPAVKPRLNLAEAAAMLGVCERTVREWVKSKGLPASKVGRDYRFDADRVSAWIDARPAKDAPAKRMK
jgi:excisionase family DNA binding protein